MDLQTKKAFGRFYQIIILFRKLSLSFHNLTQGGFLRPEGAEEAVVGELKAMGSVGSPSTQPRFWGILSNPVFKLSLAVFS